MVQKVAVYAPLMKLHNVRLLVDDVRGTFAFYRDVIGMTVTWESDVYCELSSGGGAGIGVFPRTLEAAVGGKADLPATPLAGQQDPVVIVFDASEETVDAAYERVVTAGAESVNAPHDAPQTGLRMAHVRDPAGHLIELNQPLS